MQGVKELHTVFEKKLYDFIWQLVCYGKMQSSSFILLSVCMIHIRAMSEQLTHTHHRSGRQPFEEEGYLPASRIPYGHSQLHSSVGYCH